MRFLAVWKQQPCMHDSSSAHHFVLSILCKHDIISVLITVFICRRKQDASANLCVGVKLKVCVQSKSRLRFLPACLHDFIEVFLEKMFIGESSEEKTTSWNRVERNQRCWAEALRKTVSRHSSSAEENKVHGGNCARLYTNLRETFGLSDDKWKLVKSSRQEISTKIWMFLLHLAWMCPL